MSLDDRTPWDPSPQHMARVKNKLPVPHACPYCESAIKVVGSSGEWPWFYKCSKCDASVGMHPFTNIPLGTLANEALRRARSRSKAKFNLICGNSTKKRVATYQALAEHLGIDVADCHFGFFDVETCDKAWRWALDYLATPEMAHTQGSDAAQHGARLDQCPFLSAQLIAAWRAGWHGWALICDGT